MGYFDFNYKNSRRIKNLIMKTRIFFILLFACSVLGAQEVISETQEYVSYQDSLFTLKTTQVISTGYEGIENTFITYSAPVDTAGLSGQLLTTYHNSINEAAAKMRNASPFRFTLATYVASKALLATIGLDLDSMNVARYGATYSGRWRVFNEDGTNFFANIAPHPTLPGLLRATGETNEGNFNILIYGRNFFRFAVGAGNVKYLVLSDPSAEQPFYQSPVRLTIPGAVATSSNFRMVKIQ